ncbi:MAG TPA: LEA type 2 family protein [Nitrospirota bacterium]|jgi:hypothetical protein
MKKFAFAGLMLFIMLGSSACSMKDAVGRMSFELKKVHVTDMDEKGFNATLIIQVNNPNWFGVTVTDFKYKASLGGNDVASGSLGQEFKVPADGYAVAELPVVVRYGDLQGGMLAVLGGRLGYRVTGEAGFGTWLGRYALSFDTGDSTYDLPGKQRQKYGDTI